MKLKDQIKQLSEQYRNIKDIEEANVTGNLDGGEGPPSTPRAFCKCKGNDGEECQCNHDVEANGYEEVKLSEYKKRMLDQVSLKKEITYREFKKDDSMTASQKMNKKIKEINSQIFKLQREVKRCSKLKKDMGLTEDDVWKTSKPKLRKIRERLVKISHEIMDLGA